MRLEDLLLKREEIWINRKSPGAFVVPIHPSLVNDLPDEIRQDGSYVLGVINDVIDWFEEDLEEYYRWLKGEGDDEKAERIKRFFLDNLPVARKEWGYGSNIGGYWNIDITHHKGFPYSMGITSDTHLYIASGVIEIARIGSWNCGFSKEKFLKYMSGGDLYESEGHYACKCFGWLAHNVDNMPQALFLRNWAILYHNKLLRVLHEKES